MKYYLGSVVINDWESNREYERVCALAARDEAAAKRLLDDWAAEWDSDGHTFGGGWLYSQGHCPYLVTPNDRLKPLTAAAFDSLKDCIVSFVEAGAAGELSQEPADERVKTLARRIGEQLKKHDAKVAHGKLLHAVAASLGETDWQVLLHKAAPIAASSTCVEPEGWPANGEVQPFVPGEGALWEVPVTVDTTMSARVKVRATSKGAAMLAARQFAADGNVRFEPDEGNYRGVADHYVPDANDVVCVDDSALTEAPFETERGVRAGPYRVELCELEPDDDMLWADLEVMTDDGEEHVSSAMSCIERTASRTERMRVCKRVAELFVRHAPAGNELSLRTMEHVFIDAMQGDQSEAAFEALERKLKLLVEQERGYR